jgi:hypothetical protein
MQLIDFEYSHSQPNSILLEIMRQKDVTQNKYEDMCRKYENLKQRFGDESVRSGKSVLSGIPRVFPSAQRSQRKPTVPANDQ